MFLPKMLLIFMQLKCTVINPCGFRPKGKTKKIRQISLLISSVSKVRSAPS